MNINELHFATGDITESVDPALLDDFLQSLPAWRVSGVSIATLVRDFKFSNFVDAMSFAEDICSLAEQYNHHPELKITYGNLQVSWWTHTASGITTNDLFMAGQCDQAYANDRETN